MDGQFAFSEEQPSDDAAAEDVWRVLAVDGGEFQRATTFVLSDIELLGGRVELIQAFSCSEAEKLLASYKDIASVMFDAVMESEESGLRLIKYLRDEIDNSHTRVVLLTGEPGLFPAPDVMRDYDINDYWAKSELNPERLLTVLAAAVRGYAQLRAVAKARRGLQRIVDLSNT